jgi:endoglucanase
MNPKPLLPLGLALLCGSCMTNVQAQNNRTPNSLKPTQIYTVRPDILAIEIDTGSIDRATPRPYTKQSGDVIMQPRPKIGDDWVKSPMGTKGALVGSDRKNIFPFDKRQGHRLNLIPWKKNTTVNIQSLDDNEYAKTQHPKAIHRKTRPTDMALIGEWKMDTIERHTFYLQLPQPLTPNKTYQLSFPGTQLLSQTEQVPAISFRYQPDQQRSEAIQVTHTGFRPDDLAKVAFLSTWMGDGGGVTYREGMKFWLTPNQPGLFNKTPKPVFQGETKLSRRHQDPEDAKDRNYTKTDVYTLDFSTFNQPGEYRVCVETIGCSFPFKIDPKVWDKPFYTAARGLYHQRSSIAIGPPYSIYKRPRAFHPKDGVKIYQATARLVDNDQGIPGKPPYKDVLPKTKTTEILTDAWGGYFDAGDWDRRIQHVEVSRSLIELTELFPDFFDRFSLNIPESGSKYPDLIDEALWNLDFFRRLQTADGGIRGGIQSAAYPRQGEASWNESLDVLAYAPDPWSSFTYVTGAAQLAHWLQERDPKLAQTYQDSALRAMEYAEREIQKPTESSRTLFQTRDARNLAALALWRLTNNDRWMKIFQTTTVFQDPNKPLAEWNSHDQKDAAFLYLRLPTQPGQEKLRANINNALYRDANRALNNTNQTAHKWAKDNDYAPVGYGNGLGTPKAISLLRAHYLSNDDKYLRAATLSTQFSLGANPLNMSYTTGLGYRNPRNPLITDQRITNQAPPPGITVYGPIDPIEFSNEWFWDLIKPATYPAINQWPATEAYFDIHWAPAITEYTVMETIAPSTYIWGYLAARPK